MVSDVEGQNFHDDSSNVYSTDDEVCVVKEKRKQIEEQKAVVT